MPVALTLKCFSVPQLELCVISAANQTLADVSLFCARFLDEVLNMRAANQIRLYRPNGVPTGLLDMQKNLGDLVGSCILFTFDGQVPASPRLTSARDTTVVTVVPPGAKFVELKHNVRVARDTVGSKVLEELGSRLSLSWRKLQLFVVKADGDSIEILDPRKSLPQNAQIRLQQQFDTPFVTVAVMNKSTQGDPKSSGIVFQMGWVRKVILPLNRQGRDESRITSRSRSKTSTSGRPTGSHNAAGPSTSGIFSASAQLSRNDRPEASTVVGNIVGFNGIDL
jgi:hypothetical protein